MNDFSLFEVVIKKEDHLEDDIFADIFDDKSNVENKNFIENLKIINTQQDKVQNQNKLDVINNESQNDFKPVKSEFKNESNLVHPVEVEKDKTNIKNPEIMDLTEQVDTIKQIDFIKQVDTSTQADTTKQADKTKQMDKSSKPDESNIPNVAPSIQQPPLTTKELEELKENLFSEGQELIAERATKERLAGNLSEQMYQEAQVSLYYLSDILLLL